MKKPKEKLEMRPEYAFGGGVRGKYAGRVREEDVTYPAGEPHEHTPRMVALIEDVHAALNQFARALAVDLQPVLAQWAAWDLVADAALKRFADQGYPVAQLESILTDAQIALLVEDVASQRGDSIDASALDHLIFRFTCEPSFAVQVRRGMQGLDFLAPRVRHFDALWHAHAAEQFLLAIPATIILIEGTLGEFNERCRGGQQGTGKLKQKLEVSRLREHEHFEQVAESLVDHIVPQRNAILHGNVVNYDSEVLSTKLLIYFHGLIDVMNLVSKN